ncbi:MAG: hypothetical protein ACO1OK_01780 [Devosia sp.]|uniref:Uncharacterized protein n=1 Tax=Devosia enhydra TaxID=665118 RepID=A0A1K2HSH2_9HYPH|nr:hypothetical protein [Devosia enhydra]SFZ80920.1 hypothetical protein SAMN02983003_0208 [Devosia enhydra]
MSAMPFRMSEVCAALTLMIALIGAKYLPMLSFLPLSQMAGITAFSFAIFLALRLYQYELAQLDS